MKLAIVKYDSPETNKIEKELSISVMNRNWIESRKSDVVVSIGGDGTFCQPSSNILIARLY